VLVGQDSAVTKVYVLTGLRVMAHGAVQLTIRLSVHPVSVVRAIPEV